MEKTRTTVRIAGKDYTMASYDSEDYVRRVAIYVDRKLRELSLATHLPAQELAVLTALNIADDMFKAHDENARLRRGMLEARHELTEARKELIALRAKQE